MISFYHWILDHADENTVFGDLGSDIRDDARAAPSAFRNIESSLAYLRSCGACFQALKVLKEAWREFNGAVCEEDAPDEDE